MSASIYNDKLIQPNELMLKNDLSESYESFVQISRFIDVQYGDLSLIWKFYSQKSGWILKMLTKNKNVLFLIPCDKFFKVAFTFGEKATDLILNSDFPDFIKKELSNSKKYVEGRTIQFDVKTSADLDSVLKMIAIKLL